MKLIEKWDFLRNKRDSRKETIPTTLMNKSCVILFRILIQIAHCRLL